MFRTCPHVVLALVKGVYSTIALTSAGAQLSTSAACLPAAMLKDLQMTVGEVRELAEKIQHVRGVAMQAVDDKESIRPATDRRTQTSQGARP